MLRTLIDARALLATLVAAVVGMSRATGPNCFSYLPCTARRHVMTASSSSLDHEEVTDSSL